MTSRTPRRWVSLPLLLLVLAVLGFSQPTAIATTTQSQSGQDLLVVLDSVSPAVATPDGALTVRGTLRNVGSQSVAVDSLEVTSANVGLDTVDRITSWSMGADVIATPISLVLDDTDQQINPGESVSFSLEVEAGQINPGFAYGTLPLLVTSTDGLGNTSQLRTVLPWYDAQTAQNPVQVSWVVPMTVPPEPDLMSNDAEARAQAWLDILDPAAPTRTWLSGLASAEATYLLDPALLLPTSPVGSLRTPSAQLPMPLPTDAVTVGPQPSADSDAAAATAEPSPPVAPEEGTTSAGPGVGGATLDITELQRAELEFYRDLAAVGSDRLWFLPPQDPDVAALLDLDADPDLITSLLAATSPRASGAGTEIIDAGRHDVAYPQWSQVAEQDISDLNAVWPGPKNPSILVPSDAVQNSAASAVNRVSVDGQDTTLLAFDTDISGLLSQDADADSDGDIIQQALAYTMARYQRSPNAQHSMIITPPRGSDVDGQTLTDLSVAFQDAGWVSTVDVESLSPDAPDSSLTGAALTAAAPGDPTAYPMPGPSPLTAERLIEIETVRSNSDDVSTVLPANSNASHWDAALDELYSSRWRDDDTQWLAPLVDIEDQVEQVRTGVAITPTSINFLADEGQIQITVTNDLPVDLENLQLNLTPGNARLNITEVPESLSIGANSRASVQFRAEAVAAGQVPVTASLSTPNGTILGDEEVISVGVQPTGDWIYWVLGVLGGGILILGLARLGRRPKRYDSNTEGDNVGAQALDSPKPPTNQPKDAP